MKPSARFLNHALFRAVAGQVDRHLEGTVFPAHFEGRRPACGDLRLSGRTLQTQKVNRGVRHASSSIGLRTSDGSGPGRAVERASRRPVRACALLATLALAGCEADAIAARAALTELGYHGIAIRPAPMFDRPCGWGEPFAVRFRAVTEDGRIVGGILCSADEATEDARLLPDAEGRH